MSWGSELWDKYDELYRYTSNGIDFVEGSVASFLRERGKIEGDYAAKLRNLVKKYTPKERDAATREEEFTYICAYKKMLQEVGFLAGQHELLAENYSKDNYKKLLENVKRLKEKRKKNMKDSEKLASDLKHAFKIMEASREKFRKSYEEQEKAILTYKRADSDGNVARNEVEKLRLQANTRSQHCDSIKGLYASQLVKTNEFQRDYYNRLLPTILDGLQDLEKDRILLMKNSVMSCVDKEKEVTRIIMKCQDDIINALKEIKPEEDTEIVIERFKSGDVPPGDFKFDDMQSPLEMLNKEPVEKATNFNLYPRKRQLERQIEDTEKELGKCQKEKQSLQTMVSTYEKNPKFGDSKKFHGEIQNLTQKIRNMESVLETLHGEHSLVEEQLESLKSRGSPSVNDGSPMLGLQRDHTPRSSHSSGSLKSSSLSIGSTQASSSLMNTSPDHSVPEESEVVYDIPEVSETWNHHNDNSTNNNYGEDELPPPPPLQISGDSSSELCVALYPYSGDPDQESIIPMAEGEQFRIVEPDCEGWTHVKRINNNHYNDSGEGYVPSSYLKIL